MYVVTTYNIAHIRSDCWTMLYLHNDQIVQSLTFANVQKEVRKIQQASALNITEVGTHTTHTENRTLVTHIQCILLCIPYYILYYILYYYTQCNPCTANGIEYKPGEYTCMYVTIFLFFIISFHVE